MILLLKIPLAIAAAAALIGAIWGTMALVGRFGPFGRLVARYPAPESFAGKRYWFRSAHFGGTLTSGMLVAGADARGLYLGIHALMIPGPALYVPWADVTTREEHEVLGKRVVFVFSAVPDAEVKVRLGLARRLAAASEGGLVLDEL